MTISDANGGWLFIGAGNMGRAIASGAASALGAAALAAVDPHAPDGAPFGKVMRTPEESVGAWLKARPGAGLVLAVKPQAFETVAAGWRRVLDACGPRVVVSVMAGVRAETIARAMGPAARVVRVMPNTPIGVGMGMSAMCAGPGAGEDDLAAAESLFGASGLTMRIDESLMDAFTAVAGSGPAYAFYLAEAMVDAAERLGFDREQALTAVRQTLAGAGAMLARSPEPPESLRAAVTSKGGTTAAATDALDARGVRDAVIRAVEAARDRGAALGRGENA